MTGWLDGRRALVVGAGSGIGRAVVDAYLAEGASVAVLERDEAKCAALAAERPEVVVTAGDATTGAANDEAVRAAVDAFGGLDVLVSCIGVFDFYRGLGELAADDLDAAFAEVFAVNVKSCLHSVKAALPHLSGGDGTGAVVLTTSTSAHYAGRGGVLYVSSKFALRGVVTALAHELAPTVRVNAVAPGGTLGTDLRGAGSLGLSERRLDNPDRATELRERNPLRVALAGGDHAWSYVFLASTRAGGITGGVVHSDGGIGVRG